MNIELEVLEEVSSILESPSQLENDYECVIGKLNPIVIQSAEDEDYRHQLASNKVIWSTVNDCLRKSDGIDFSTVSSSNIKLLCLRLIRGLIILLRNLSASNQAIPNELLMQNTVIRVFGSMLQLQVELNEMVSALYIATLSFLHNITQGASIFDVASLDSTIEFLSYAQTSTNNNLGMLFPYLLFFLNTIQNDDFLYHFFRHSNATNILYNIIIDDITYNHSNLFEHMKKIEDEDNINTSKSTLSDIDIILLKIFMKIASNESFAPYFQKLKVYEPSHFVTLLKLMQLTITSTDDWDKYQLTAIMAWCFRIFEFTALEIETYFKEKVEDETNANNLHDNIVIILDIFSKLSQYEHVQKFIVFYKGVEKIIALFQVLQDNLIRINFQKDIQGNIKSMKTTNSLGDKISDKKLLLSRVDFDNYNIKSTNFPECKLLIVEILTMLAYNNKEIQDNIRNLHGLQLVLSNCVIDDNDPFIKERSIVCIRVLLTENKENQDFVAKLESKKAINNEIIEEAGYEVKINEDGSVKLKSKQTVSPRPQ